MERQRAAWHARWVPLLAVLGFVSFGSVQAAQEGVVEEVIVTGSYIRGTPEDAALPVDVIDAEEMAERGSPTALDLIRAMPYVGPSMGETNQFGVNQGTIGVGNVNLRGLGGMRTLVLMNGRRTTYTPAEGPTGVDTNLLPFAAIGRVEVLKDGAAATYGSDAIAGVVNFITRRDLEGFEVNGEFRSIEDNDGDWTGSVNWGWQGDQSNVLISYAQQHRSELRSTDRDWANPPYTVNPTGWSGFGDPGTFFATDLDTATNVFRVDSNCTELGGHLEAAACRFSYIPFDNIVEETEQQQIYGELNTEIAPGTEFHIEGLWAETILPNYRTSPSYPPTSGPAGPGFAQFRICNNGTYNFATGTCSAPLPGAQFANNPGVITALQQTALTQAQIDATDVVQLLSWRPQAWGGVPALTGGNGGQLNRNTYDMARVSAGLKGTLEGGWMDGIGWDFAVTYSASTMTRSGVDTMITRMQDAINGLGGPDCNGIAYGQPGSTCGFYNPFSNAHPANAAYGYVNPGYVSANANTPEMLNWLIERWTVAQDQSLLVADAVFNGEIPGFELPGGSVGWAFGGQYRLIDYSTTVDNPLANQEINPCVVPGDTSCEVKTGPFIFLGQFINQSLDDTVYAVFGELALPITDTLDAQVSVRYEDYGGLTGDTTDPKFSVRWQAVDWLALRGSIGSTFRGPTPVNKALIATGLQPIPAAAFQYRSIDIVGNPELDPEKADTWSLGAVVEVGGFRGIIDYFTFEFKDQIYLVPYTSISDAVGNIAAGTSGTQLADCNHPLRALVVFSNSDTCTQGVTTANDMVRILPPTVNGPKIDMTGIDVSLSYDFSELLGAELEVGVDASYVDEWKQAAFSYQGTPVLGEFDAVGYLNYDRLGNGAVPEWKALGHIRYATGPFNARYELRYVQGVADDRRPFPTVQPTTGAAFTTYFGSQIDSTYTHNLYFQYQAPWDTVVSLSIVNVLDEDPSDARHALSYDPYYGDPLGRTFEIGFRKTFGPG